MIATDRVVLIGEPDEPTNELYQRTLRTAFHVIAAPDAHALLAALHTQPVDGDVNTVTSPFCR